MREWTVKHTDCWGITNALPIHFLVGAGFVPVRAKVRRRIFPLLGHVLQTLAERLEGSLAKRAYDHFITLIANHVFILLEKTACLKSVTEHGRPLLFHPRKL
jgi:hypothetical protein